MSQPSSRKNTPGKSSPLPHDFLKLVTEIFSANYAEALKKMVARGWLKKPRFEASGAILPDEVLVRITLASEGSIAATTVHASSDFDPKASAPQLQELLGACVDAIGEVLAPVFEKQAEELASDSLSALDDVPFEWTQLTIESEGSKRKVFVKLDKANPALDGMADAWLEKHDPDRAERERREREETEALFVTGPKKPSTE